MISLSRHIELLLLEHNCVIVPGLGGFIANTASATYNDGPDGDKLFMPPYRTIGFNSQLQVNDGLLVQSYMQAYDASYPAACLQMEKEIEQLNMQLNLVGKYNLEGIGTLHKSLGESIVLTSSEAGILTPSLYGTYSFGIKNLAEVTRERQIQQAVDQTNIMPIQTETDLKLHETTADKQTENEKAPIPLKRKDSKQSHSTSHNYWAEFGVASAVAAIIFLVWLIPNTITMNGKKETVIAGAPLVENRIDDKAKVKEIKPHTVEPKTTDTPSAVTHDETEDGQTTHEEVADTDNQQTAHPQLTQPQAEKNYTLVLASFVTEKNSNILIANLAAQGFTEAKFVKKGKTTRVIYSAYTTEQEAVNALLSLREKNEAFRDAWTMKMN